MKMKLLGAALALMMASGAATAQGMPVHADDPWAKAIGDTRTLEADHIGCTTQRDVKLVSAIQHNTIGISMDLPAGCTFFPRGDQVVIIKLEYSASGSCGIAICAQIHLVDDMRRYWMDAPVELFEAK
jgi:hypothetical protein